MFTLRMLPLLLAAATASAAERIVPFDYVTIQEAIAAAVDGDTVLVAPGTYLEHVELGDKRIAVRSMSGATYTVIDGGNLPGAVVRIGAGATRETLLEGFTIKRGVGSDTAGGIDVDGGSPTIRGNVVVDNRGGRRGNGISTQSSGALITGNRIAGNHNGNQGSGGGGAGGLYLSGVCRGDGCSLRVEDNLIEGNTALEFTDGGGMTLEANHARVTGNVIRDNVAGTQGGGILLASLLTDVVVENNLLLRNRVANRNGGGSGGGMFVRVPSQLEAAPFIINNTFIGNQAPQGSAIDFEGSDVAARFVNNLVVGVADVAPVYCSPYSDQFPPIVRNNNVVVEGAAAYAGRCEGAEGTQGNIAAMPRFAGADDYRLADGSPGIDAGHNGFSSDPVDLAGNPRIQDGDGQGGATVDIGAYEFTDAIFADSFDD